MSISRSERCAVIIALIDLIPSKKLKCLSIMWRFGKVTVAPYSQYDLCLTIALHSSSTAADLQSTKDESASNGVVMHPSLF